MIIYVNNLFQRLIIDALKVKKLTGFSSPFVYKLITFRKTTMNKQKEKNHYYRNEYEVVRNHIASKAECLWKHDNKTDNFSASNSRTVKFSINNYKRLIINNRCFYLVFSNKFKDAITTPWIDISLKSLSQECSQRCAKDVIKSLYDSERFYNQCTHANWKGRLDEYENLLKPSCCYIVEVKGNSQNSKFLEGNYKEMFVDYAIPVDSVDSEGIVLDKRILMLKFFNKLQKTGEYNGKYEFTGGLFHALKHFSINGIFIGGNYREDIEMPSIDCFCQIIKNVIEGFYFSELSKSDENRSKFSSIIKTGDDSKFKTVFLPRKY